MLIIIGNNDVVSRTELVNNRDVKNLSTMDVRSSLFFIMSFVALTS
ncbi:hypothetical protein MNBD_GAMMA09-2602 [hydrothermal vent metagenome]|uniref:Uncharacterized protein n=1 Tax=hydrothermal vent metagenome TaxID=652676 RepID=A0A3B0XLL0_9ZZZZ